MFSPLASRVYSRLSSVSPVTRVVASAALCVRVGFSALKISREVFSPLHHSFFSTTERAFFAVSPIMHILFSHTSHRDCGSPFDFNWPPPPRGEPSCCYRVYTVYTVFLSTTPPPLNPEFDVLSILTAGYWEKILADLFWDTSRELIVLPSLSSPPPLS